MLIDIVFLGLVAFGFYRGFTRGLIIAVFATIAWILGLAGGLKFASVGAVYMRDELHINTAYNPLISFIVIMVVIGFVVFLMGKALQKLLEAAQLGLLNKMLGGILVAGIHFLLFSALLWLINQAGMVSPEAKTQSKVYGYVSPVMPFVIDHMGEWLPSVKGLLSDIENYYNRFTLQEILK